MLVNMVEMLNKAKEGKYAVGQFNINNLEWTKTILLTAQEQNSPVILGVSEGAAKYMGGFTTVVGMVIGGGVFFKPQAVYEITGGAPGLGMIAWVLAGIMTITAGLTAAEVSAAIPKTGGMMVYIEEIYGEKLGFLTGWMQSVLFFPATIAAISVMFGQQAAILLGNEANGVKKELLENANPDEIKEMFENEGVYKLSGKFKIHCPYFKKRNYFSSYRCFFNWSYWRSIFP